jgi:uncharacterized protein
MPRTFLLTYTYVPNMVELRQPHREAHLANLTTAHDHGFLLLAGAMVDPVDGAVLLFEAEDPGQVLSWAANDPYNRAGLIRGMTVRELSVAVRPSIAGLPRYAASSPS